MNKFPELSIIIPSFNEDKTIAEVLVNLKKELENKLTYEIIVVNDGSTDNSREILEAIPYVKLINNKVNRGYSSSIKTGIENSKYDWIMTFDGDASHPPHQIMDLLVYCNEYDLIVGARVGKQAYDTVLRKIGRRIVTKFAQYISKAEIPDINSGFRVFKKDLAKKFWNLFPEGFSFSTTITVASHVARYAVKYVPIETYKRQSGKSGIKPVRDMVGFLNIVTRFAIYFQPLRVFVSLSILFFMAAIIVVFLDYYFVNGVLDTTFAILFNTSIQALMFGLIAEMIVKRFYS
jgi:glycosyltransferase involved in cell wall biosynthesis